MRRVTAALVVALLAIGIVFMWPRGAAETPPSTSTSTSRPATTDTSATSTTASTTTTEPDSHVVTTVEEAEAILRELWFGWFEGIYNEDVDRIREVVATEHRVDEAKAAFGVVAFAGPPTIEGTTFEIFEIVYSDPECLVVWSISRSTFVEGSTPRSGLEVLRMVKGGWRLHSSWRYREDLWQEDCTSLLPSS